MLRNGRLRAPSRTARLCNGHLQWRFCVVVTRREELCPGAIALFLLFALFGTVSAWAVDPGSHISQYSHLAWRRQDGFFTARPIGLAQTQDGYIWIGTDSGLLRFDGVRFLPWKLEHGEQISSINSAPLKEASDGSLWVPVFGGASHWKDRTLTTYPGGAAASFLEDSKGKIWFGRSSFEDGTGPLCEVLGTHARCYGAADGVPGTRVKNLLEDRNGDLWFSNFNAVVRWNPSSHSSSVYQLGPKAGLGSEIRGFVAAPDGSLLVGVQVAGPGYGLERLVGGHWEPFRVPGFDGSTLEVQALHLDREGALWVGTFDRGIYRIYDNRVERFDSTNGLSDDWVWGFMEDKEGNLWVATPSGIDRFADTAATTFSSKEGLCSNEASSLIVSRDGSIWSGGTKALSHLHDGTVSCIRAENGLPGRTVMSLFEDHVGRLWLGVDQGFWLYDHGAFHEVKQPDGKPTGTVRGIAEDADHTIWIVSPNAMRVQGLVAREEPMLHGRADRVVAGPNGGIWLGLHSGDLVFYQNGKKEVFPFPHGLAGYVNLFVTREDGLVLAATSHGLIGWYKGQRVMLNRKNGLPSDGVNGLVFDKGGNLWLFMDTGAGEMTRADLQSCLENPKTTVSLKTFDVLDGVATGWTMVPGTGRTADGKLWFANERSLLTLDPANLRPNTIPPPVQVEQVIVDHQSYAATGFVHLPAHTRDIEIDYAGLSFAAPQKVGFKYMLEKVDRGWQDVGTRREAFYTKLSPGRYRFRVIACNNDGVWNDVGATLDFSIAPAWYQTLWFLVACAMAFVASLWGLYRYRMHQLGRQFDLRLEERLGERTRIARDLHDTMLQSFQGSVFEFQAVQKLLSNRPEEAKPALDRAIGSARAAIAEGRQAIQGLRTGSGARESLSDLLRTAGKQCLEAQPQTKRFLHSMSPWKARRSPWRPFFRTNSSGSAQEILRNAFRHAHAKADRGRNSVLRSGAAPSDSRRWNRN